MLSIPTWGGAHAHTHTYTFPFIFIQKFFLQLHEKINGVHISLQIFLYLEFTSGRQL